MQRRRPTSFGSPQLGQPQPQTASDWNTQQGNQQQAINIAAANQYAQQRAGQLGQPIPNPIPSMADVDPNNASAYNNAQGQLQQSWNQYAANQYAQQRQAQLGNQTGIDLTKINTEQNRQLLAKGFGYKSGETVPNMGQLYSQYMGLSPDKQANLYRHGYVPWLDAGGEDQTGTELQAAVNKVVNNHKDEMANKMSEGFQAGKIKYDPKSPTGYTQIVDVPPIAPGMASTPTEVPANSSTVDYINLAIQKGLMRDPKTGKLASQTDPVQGPPMSTDQFQQILNARAQGGNDTDRFQQVLNQHAGSVQTQQPSFSSVAQVTGLPSTYHAPLNTDSIGNQANMSLAPYNYNSTMALGPTAYQNPLAFNSSAPPTDLNDPFVQAHNYLTTPQTGNNVSNALNAFNTFNPGNVGTGLLTNPDTLSALKATGASLLNIPARMSNAALRLLGGSGGGQYGQVPLQQSDAQQPAVDPAVLAALKAQQQQSQPDLSDMQLMGP